MKIIFGLIFFVHLLAQSLAAQTTFIRSSPNDSKQYFASRSDEVSLNSKSSFSVQDTITPEWIYHTNAPMLSSPKMADLDGDGVKDIIFTTYGEPPNPYTAGFVFVVDTGGNDLPGWPVQLNAPLPASPAVGDIDNDGMPDLVAASWNALYAWNANGVIHNGFPIFIGTSVTPTLFDVDQDDELEIIYPASNQFLYVYNHDGTLLPGWPVSAPDLIGTPAIADIDNDNAYEIVAGTYQGPVGPDPFEVYAWELNGTVISGFPVQTCGVVKGSPAIGDLEGDGILEIIAVAYHTSNQDSLYVWDAQGNIKPGFPVAVAYGRLSSPALGDIDGDGDLEIVIGGRSASPITEMLFAFHRDGSTVTNWPVVLNHPGSSGNINSSPIIVDIDGDTSTMEILVKTVDHIFALHGDGTLVDGYPYFISDGGNTGTHSPSPVVDDVDGDGDTELVFAASFDQIAFFDPDDSFSDSRSFWPTYKHDAWNTASTALLDSVTAIARKTSAIPDRFSVFQNFPNPFNPTTMIRFQIPNRALVDLAVYDLSGKQIATLIKEERPAGEYQIEFNGSNLASGIYFYRLQAGQFSQVKKMILMK